MMGVPAREYARWFTRILAVWGAWALSATVWRLVDLSCKAPQYPEACATATHRAELIALVMLIGLLSVTFFAGQLAVRVAGDDDE